MQSSFGVRLAMGFGDERRTRMCVDGWEVGNKSRAAQWCSAIWWEAHFSCVVCPHTGWVIRANHLSPHPRVWQRMRKTGGRNSTIVYCPYDIPRHCGGICWWALARFPSRLSFYLFSHCLSNFLCLLTFFYSIFFPFLFLLSWILYFFLSLFLYFLPWYFHSSPSTFIKSLPFSSICAPFLPFLPSSFLPI